VTARDVLLNLPLPYLSILTGYGLDMGVHGLTTYLRENQRVLGKARQFPLTHVSGNTITTIVVDGWS
jgi:hypothetical protein